MSAANESIHDLVELYSISALDADEAHQFETHLPSCEKCRIALGEMQALLIELDTELLAGPPPGVKTRVMEEIARTGQVGHPSSTPSGPTDLRPAGYEPALDEPAGDEPVVTSTVIDLTERRFGRFSPALQAVAAAMVVVVAVGASILFSMSSSTRFVDVARADDAATVALEGTVGGDVTVAWSESEGQLAVMASGLGALPSDQTYELWLFDGDVPVAAGIFVPNSDGAVDFVGDLSAEPSLWAITVEPAGGVEVPTTDPIFVGGI